MKKFKHIYLVIMAALLVASCQEGPLEPVNPNDLPEGYVKVVIDMERDFGTQEIATRSDERAGDPMIATPREMGISNAFVCVFQNQGGSFAEDKLLQYEPVIRDFDASGNPHYYAVLEEVSEKVIIHGLSNIDDRTVGEITAKIGDQYSITREGFYALEIPYSNDPSSVLLKNQNGALLPKFTEAIVLDELTPATIQGTTATTRFSYTRVDVVMPTIVGSDYPKVLGLSATNVPTLPPRGDAPVTVRSHEVTPISNLPAYGETIDSRMWPTGVTAANEGTKYVQGLYMYYNNRLPAGATSPTTPVTEDDAIELIIRAQRDENSPADGTYYKILLRYKNEGALDYSYDTYTANRYLVNVHALNSAGYSTWEEAAAAPPSNVLYDITIDGTSTSYVTNGQYYIGTEKTALSAEGRSQSNMVYANPQITEFANKSDESWKINDDGSLGVDLVFSYNAGNGSSLVVGDLTTKEIILPDGVEFDNTAVGYDNATWNNNFGTKKLRLKVTKSDVDSDIEIKIGELTHKVKITAKGELYTDYTDIDFVKELTNLDYTYGGVPTGQVRVANSYILAPTQTSPTTYYIPVAERINEFWNTTDGHAGASATDIYADLLTVDWTNNTSYSVEVSWYDGADIDNLVVEKAYSPKNKNAIKVTLPSDLEHQNVVVNVKYGTTIIWSWHLWVTDYNPYFTELKANESSELKYPVRTKTDQNLTMPGTDNALHSYAGALWQTGIYKDKFIMDRNLGAFGDDFEGHGSVSGESSRNKGSLRFMFGRKDPLPRIATYVNGNSYIPESKIGVKFYEAVNEPTTMYLGSNGIWTNETIVTNLNIIWFDKNISTINYTSGKSIFDPSPLGFRVPIKGVWDAFSTSTFSWIGSSGTSVYQYGRTYKDFAYYPASGELRSWDGLIYVNSGVNGVYRTATPFNSIKAYLLHLDNSVVEPNQAFSYTGGFIIRPIQE